MRDDFRGPLETGMGWDGMSVPSVEGGEENEDNHLPAVRGKRRCNAHASPSAWSLTLPPGQFSDLHC